MEIGTGIDVYRFVSRKRTFRWTGEKPNPTPQSGYHAHPGQ